MTAPIRWGILGTGSIAKQFARGLQALDDARLVAVGSRAAATAEAFGTEFDVPRLHASYEALAADPEVDAIYVATPHPLHRENAILCLEAGKAVLCEKPFTINARQAAEVVAVARRKRVFLMEAMWTRFLPIVAQAREWIASGAVGEPRLVTADFGFRAGVNPESRLFNPRLGGGALLDVGIYTVSFASMVFGPKPTRIESMATLGETGVDEQAAVILGYGNGALAALTTAIRTNTPHEARIIGTDGRILLHPPYWRGTKATLQAGGKEETVELPLQGNGYNYEAAEVGRCLRAGELESPVMTLDDTVAIVGILDAIRAQWGLKYPME